MVPSVLSSTHEAVLKAVAQSAAGANIEQIEAQLPQPPTRRTLQRWLNVLVGQGRLRKEGQARSTRYLLPVQAAPEAAAAAPGDVSLPLSDEARAIDIAVRQPVQHRTPVGYRRSFLDSYRPNTTFYLPAALRTGC